MGTLNYMGREAQALWLPVCGLSGTQQIRSHETSLMSQAQRYQRMRILTDSKIYHRFIVLGPLG